jgi:hypothetical protein
MQNNNILLCTEHIHSLQKTLSLWQAQLKSNRPSYIPNTVVALQDNVTKKNQIA